MDYVLPTHSHFAGRGCEIRIQRRCACTISRRRRKAFYPAGPSETVDWSREFPFELFVCRWAERRWPPDGPLDDETTVLVGRQLGTKTRRWDTVIATAPTERLRERARFGSRQLDYDLLRVVRHAPEEWAWYRDAIPDPGFPWRYVREAIHRAADRGVVETRRAGNRLEFRRRWPFPEWPGRIVAVENKPDLNASAARALVDQLQRDVALGLADEVWVATLATGDRIEPVLFEDLPVEAGILAVDPESETVEVLWHPRSIDVDGPGTRILDRPNGGDRDRSAATFEYVDPAWKARTRLAIAERLYERGWRSYVDSMRPDCRQFGLEAHDGLVPTCAVKEHCPRPAECSGSCESFEPEPPSWRTRGWPIEGGPGRRLRAILDDRRERRRPDESS